MKLSHNVHQQISANGHMSRWFTAVALQ